VFTTRTIVLAGLLFVAVSTAAAGETNYFCTVCGQGPLTGRVWLSKWGAVCDDCYRLPNHCYLCGLPVRAGDGHVKTGDGRLICRFDKTNAVLDAAGARQVFEDARRDLLNLFGPDFALRYPDVTVNLFDVDYWTARGRDDGQHEFGFASTRRTSDGQCTHEVVMLSGRPRDEIAATAAHEYTHLWINENVPPDRKLAPDTEEAICELSAYKLMESRSQPEEERKILNNPYTHGEITNLVDVERKTGMNHVLDWVKRETTETVASAALFAPAAWSASVFTRPPPLPETLKFGGLITLGPNLQAVINGVAFAAGETKNIRLRGRTVSVLCRHVRPGEVVLDLDGSATTVTLKSGEETAVP
jgi:hypothetical protein